MYGEVHPTPSRWGTVRAVTRRLVFVLLALFVASTLSPAAPASAAPTLGSGVTQHVTFNDPHNKLGYNTAIIAEWERALKEAPAGSKVRIVTWRWNPPAPPDLPTELAIDALKRGVDIRIAIAGHSWEFTQTLRLAKEMNAIRPGSVVKCSSTEFDNAACLSKSPGGTAHNNLGTFSYTGGKRNVVMVTAHNISGGQIGTYNDNLVTAGDLGYYDQMTRYLEDVLAKRRDSAYRQNKGTFSSPGALTNTWAGPSSPSLKIDNIAQVLAGLSGRSGCRVEVPTSKLNDQRKKVAFELARLKKEGCYVGLLTRIASDDSADEVRAVLTGAGIKWKVGDPHQHMKVVIVRGALVRGTLTPTDAFVLHGSEHPAKNDVWRNDELLSNNRNPAIVKAYADWFAVGANRAGLALAA